MTHPPLMPSTPTYRVIFNNRLEDFLTLEDHAVLHFVKVDFNFLYEYILATWWTYMPALMVSDTGVEDFIYTDVAEYLDGILKIDYNKEGSVHLELLSEHFDALLVIIRKLALKIKPFLSVLPENLNAHATFHALKESHAGANVIEVWSEDV